MKNIEDMTDDEINELKRRAIERLQGQRRPKHVKSERVSDTEEESHDTRTKNGN